MRKQRVLVAPLDWGLGHASRMVPVIKLLMERNCEVMIAGSGDSLALLRAEFPELQYFALAPYAPSYSRTSSLVMKMATQIVKFIRAIRAEHEQIETLVKAHALDLIISDNRFGCWSHRVKSIFVTHQVNILLPASVRWLEGIVNYFNHRYISKFNECWVPDWQGEKSLAGKLSQTTLKARYIGPLTRFELLNGAAERLFDILVLLSGPEPQRTMLEDIMLEKLSVTTKKICIVRGVPGNGISKAGAHITVVDFKNGKELQSMIHQSGVLISRSGYSTVMDLTMAGGKVVFIPTPGQPEQEYLAINFREKGISSCVRQDSFDLDEALHESERYTGFARCEVNEGPLRAAISDALK